MQCHEILMPAHKFLWRFHFQIDRDAGTVQKSNVKHVSRPHMLQDRREAHRHLSLMSFIIEPLTFTYR